MKLNIIESNGNTYVLIVDCKEKINLILFSLVIFLVWILDFMFYSLDILTEYIRKQFYILI